MLLLVLGTKVGPVPCERCTEACRSYIPQPARHREHHHPVGFARRAPERSAGQRPARFGFHGGLIAAELRRRKAAAELANVLEGIRAQPGEPMSEQEIVA